MPEEYFYGVTLTAAKPSIVWEPAFKDEEDLRRHKLVIKQVLLDVDAKENQYNVVQAETMSVRDTVKIPIAVLKVGETRQAQMDLDFTDSPVTFTLTTGSGPVHLHGQFITGLIEEYEDIDDIEEMAEIMDEEEEGEDEEDEDEHPKKKQKLSNNAKGKVPAGAKNNKNKK